jgi:hypothetical protein
MTRTPAAMELLIEFNELMCAQISQKVVDEQTTAQRVHDDKVKAVAAKFQTLPCT